MSAQPAAWFRLDNAALVFPAVAGSRHTTVFRISATLARPVELDRLSTALIRLARRTPYFQVHLRGGLFWYFFEENSGTQRVMADSRNPCRDFSIRGAGRFAYRVRAFGSRIALEVSHILTDGTGAMRFLRSLVAEYLRLGGCRIDAYEDLLDPDSEPDPEENEDAFDRYYRREVPGPDAKGRAWRSPSTVERRRYFVTSGRVSTKALLALARAHGVKVTPLLVAMHMEAIESSMHASDSVARPIRVLVPVNMRSFFPSSTMRNFFLYVDPEIDPRVGEWSFGEKVRIVARQMELGLDRRQLQRHLVRNIGSERNPVLRVLPRTVKDWILAYVYRRVNEPRLSGSLSNLGAVRLPESCGDHVRHLDFIPPPNPITRTNCGVVTFGDRTSITWGSVADDRTIEREFFRLLVSLGVPVELETNYTALWRDACRTVTDAE